MGTLNLNIVKNIKQVKQRTVVTRAKLHIYNLNIKVMLNKSFLKFWLKSVIFLSVVSDTPGSLFGP